MNSFSIIIVSWNALHHLKRFLPSVTETSHPRFEIILADNASTDASTGWVGENYPSVRVVKLDKNYGYCGGNNRAAKHARFDNLIFLNNDVSVEANWLQPIDKLLASNSQIAAIQPKLRSVEVPDEFEYAGAAGGFIDRYGYPYCRGRIFDTTEKDTAQYDQSSPIFWASGAALCVKKSIFNQLGGFEESFEFHMEEIDLCWRIQLSGKQVWYCPQSVVYHLGGGSLPPDNPRKVYYNFRNNLLMLVRNHPSKGLFRCMIVRLALDDVATARFLSQGKFRHAMSVIHAFFAFLRRLPSAFKFRSTHQVNNPIAVPPSTYSILWQYFVKNRKGFRDLPGRG
ncbi:MAG: glycosyltransferase family 2 protein [Balneolales bacterium]|nr:glycosyltransferase family 2 protein [Balneolales bacterium]